jgi:PIN domain nuclease of toxin-antitoxin system
VWEIAIKFALGKLSLPERPAEFVPRLLATTQVSPLAVQISHTLRVSELPMHHTDPFDRLLIAQAQIEGLQIMTADKQFRRYDVNIVWAH